MQLSLRWTLALTPFVMACASGGDSFSDGEDGGAGGQSSGGTGGASNGGMGGTGLITAGGSGGTGGEIELDAEVFGHSAEMLYRLDPDTNAVTEVGLFNGCTGIQDIALNQDSVIYGTKPASFDGNTPGGLYRIDKLTAQCTLVKTGDYPNSLSFVPVGTVDPNVEALVGYLGATYVRIDTTSGMISNIGAITGGLISSGDIVSVKNGATFLTVKPENGGDGSMCDAVDCLVEVSPITGNITKNWGPIAYNNVFGIAFWAGTVYGFTNGGEMFEITFDNNVIATAAIQTTPALSFWGAGSTTIAPPIPVAN